MTELVYAISEIEDPRTREALLSVYATQRALLVGERGDNGLIGRVTLVEKEIDEIRTDLKKIRDGVEEILSWRTGEQQRELERHRNYWNVLLSTASGKLLAAAILFLLGFVARVWAEEFFSH